MPRSRPPTPPPQDAPPAVRDHYLRASEQFYGEGLQRGVTRAPLSYEDATAQHLAQLERDHRRFLTSHDPFTQALWLALLRPAKAVLRDFKDTVAAMADPQPSDDPTERNVDNDSQPSIVALAQTMVAKGMLGDMQAATQIADRLEGKPGMRKGEQDAESLARREQMRAGIEDLIRDMTQRRLDAGEDARVIDATPTASDSGS